MHLNQSQAAYYYKILGINRKSSKAEIQGAYRTLMKKWHPDKFQQNTNEYIEATERSKIINEAYSCIRKYVSSLSSKHDSDATKQTDITEKKTKHNIDMIRIDTLNILTMGYDYNEMILQIQFKKGDIFEYYGVPKKIFTGFLNANSKNNYALRHIYNKYKYELVE